MSIKDLKQKADGFSARRTHVRVLRSCTAAAIAGAAAILPLAEASAKTIKIEASGTVAGGTDGARLFGLDSLAGASFSFVATFDLTNAVYVDGGVQTNFVGGEAYDYLQPAPPSLLVGKAVFSLNGVARELSGNRLTDLSAFANGFDMQRVSDLSLQGADHTSEAVVLQETPGFGLFGPDYTPPAGNLCTGNHACDGVYAYERTLEGRYVETFLVLDPTIVTITEVADATGAVPEPATWALMILGFGAAGSALRRRRPLAA
ncbi:MAG: PEP-CTERM sorting domain-containing protein [Phenylobacterium sp.]|uniref:PEPxxWA-CTERM sorting domain-containing protein n=1 Tax=Phenylobacterium sp. TaxID=1871053 RepID=UPI001A62B164|nr:PEPxxWA-CTERM sorting domain-containing protein [Phenylobacterium sp.]MBL8770194.1 PEP-CTERM sorting domain-containing protein [Phenylobacterium sp.]